MKTSLSNLMLIVFYSTTLTGCFYGPCGDWNCNGPNPHWRKAVNDCYSRNFGVVKQQLGYKDHGEVQDSDIGQHISAQCLYNDGRYNIRKDKQYGHLFIK